MELSQKPFHTAGNYTGSTARAEVCLDPGCWILKPRPNSTTEGALPTCWKVLKVCPSVGWKSMRPESSEHGDVVSRKGRVGWPNRESSAGLQDISVSRSRCGPNLEGERKLFPPNSCGVPLPSSKLLPNRAQPALLTHRTSPANTHFIWPFGSTATSGTCLISPLQCCCGEASSPQSSGTA